MNRFAKDVLPKWIHIGVYLRDLKYEWYSKDVMPKWIGDFSQKILVNFLSLLVHSLLPLKLVVLL